MPRLTPELRRSPAFWVASGFGVGLAPTAPGTVGTFAAVIPFLFMHDLPLPIYLGIVAATFLIGTWAAGRVIKLLGREDPGLVVIDEWVGLWIALAALPGGLPWLAAGIVLFRFFDVIKPWPVKWLDENIHGGFGAMFDDAIAGLYALFFLQSMAFLLPRWGLI